MTTKQLCAACRKWRMECTDYTQAHFAKIAGVTVQSICEFEHGRTASMRIYCAYLSCGFKLTPLTLGYSAEYTARICRADSNRLHGESPAEAFPEHMNGGGKRGKT